MKGIRERQKRTRGNELRRNISLPIIVLAAGLGSGLAVPLVLNNWDRSGPASPEAVQPQLAAARINKTEVHPPILAALDPAILVEAQTNPPPADAGTMPQETVVPRIPQPEPPATELSPNQPDIEEPQAPLADIPQALQTSQATLEDILVERPRAVHGPPREPRVLSLVVEPGDTMIDILTGSGASRRDANNAIAALEPIFNIRRLRAGQKLSITSVPDQDEAWHLSEISIRTDVDKEIRVFRSPDGLFSGEKLVTELNRDMSFNGGEITSSLYLAADRDGIPANTIVKLIRVFSYGVDFQREIHPGDAYQVLYETYSDDTGAELKQGDLLYAMLRLGSRNMALYRFKSSDGFIDYYDEKGHSIKRLLMRTPIDGARLSSRFGNRRHPILGYTKLHTGTDFAAPRGTPIMAAGDGILDHAGRKGGYGKYIRIRHNGTYSTAYAHMSRYARGMKKGKRVRQGQVIGYVGTTGRSTGNHLHYEVRKNGKPVNPMGLRLPVGRELGGKNLKAFRAQVANVQARMKELSSPLRKAQDTVPSATVKPISFSPPSAIGKGR